MSLYQNHSAWPAYYIPCLGLARLRAFHRRTRRYTPHQAEYESLSMLDSIDQDRQFSGPVTSLKIGSFRTN